MISHSQLWSPWNHGLSVSRCLANPLHQNCTARLLQMICCDLHQLDVQESVDTGKVFWINTYLTTNDHPSEWSRSGWYSQSILNVTYLITNYNPCEFVPLRLTLCFFDRYLFTSHVWLLVVISRIVKATLFSQIQKVVEQESTFHQSPLYIRGIPGQLLVVVLLYYLAIITSISPL